MKPKEELSTRIPAGFSEEAKVWVYPSTRDFGEGELIEIREQISQFVMQWESHGVAVHGYGDVLFDNTLIFIGQEAISGVSGCSTDGMVRLVKSMARQYDVDLFDRMSLMFYVKDKYQRLPMNQVQYAIDKDFLTEDTLYFDVSVSTFEQLKDRYILPIGESWLSAQLVFPS